MNFPVLHGNWIDLAVLLIIIFYLWSGWSRGLIFGLLGLGGFIISFLMALKLYSVFGKLLVDNFLLSRGIANTLGFLLAGIFTELVYTSILRYLLKKTYASLSRLVKDKEKINLYKWLDKMLGFIPVVGEGLIFTAFILTLLVTLPIQGRIKKSIVTSKIGGALVSHTQGVESHLNNIFGEAVNETLTFITINPYPASSDRIDLGFTQSEGTVDENAQRSMLVLVNIERSKSGLSVLKPTTGLTELARNHARDMFARGYFSHYNPEGESPFDRMEKANIYFLIAGENLALAPNVVLAHQGLMNSPGHRENIMSPDFNRIGIGAIDGGIYGVIFVQEFTN